MSPESQGESKDVEENKNAGDEEHVDSPIKDVEDEIKKRQQNEEETKEEEAKEVKEAEEDKEVEEGDSQVSDAFLKLQNIKPSYLENQQDGDGAQNQQKPQEQEKQPEEKGDEEVVEVEEVESVQCITCGVH